MSWNIIDELIKYREMLDDPDLQEENSAGLKSVDDDTNEDHNDALKS